MTVVRRTAARALATLALAVVPLGATTVVAVPALGSAAPDGAVELSVDGTTWSQDVTTPLFDPAFLWVPGDVETATLLVRTRSCQAATGRADVVVGPEDAELAADLDVRTRVDGGPWAPGLTSPTIAVGTGQTARLDLEVTYDPASGNETQRQRVPLDVTVTLSCDEATPPPRDGQDPEAQPPPGGGEDGGLGAPGFLPRTGIELARTVTAAVLLVLAGSWLAVKSRRRGVADD